MITEGATISAISSAFTATLRISQFVYELKAVGEQTRDLLDTTKHINESVGNVKTVRRQKSKFLSQTEKEWIDREIENTAKAVEAVAALIEPARVDMATRPDGFKSINLATRATFVLRDSPKVATNLTKLSIATQGLNTAMGILCNREGSACLGKRTTPLPGRRTSSPTGKSPPSYELSEFVNRRRTAPNMTRYTSLRSKVSTVRLESPSDGQRRSSRLDVSQAGPLPPTNTTHEQPNMAVDHTEDNADEWSEPSGSFNDPFYTETVYLDPFATTPACVPILPFDELSIDVETWTQEALQAIQEPVDRPSIVSNPPASIATTVEIPPTPCSTRHISLDSGLGRSSATDEQYDMLTKSRTAPTGRGVRASPPYPVYSHMFQTNILQMPTPSTSTSPVSPRLVKRKPLARPFSDQVQHYRAPSSPPAPPTAQPTPATQPALATHEYRSPYLRQPPVSPTQTLDNYYFTPAYPPDTSPPPPPLALFAYNPPLAPPFTHPLSTSSPSSSIPSAVYTIPNDPASQAPEVVTDRTRPQSSFHAPFVSPNLDDVARRGEEKKLLISSFREERSEDYAPEAGMQGRSRGRKWLERRAGIGIGDDDLDRLDR